MTTILNAMASKKESYMEGVKTNQSLCNTFADRMTTGAGLEEKLISINKGSSEEENLVPEEDLVSFFEEQKTRLKALAESNAGRGRKIEAFANAITKLKEKVASDTTAEFHSEDTKYETVIEDLMKKETERLNKDQGDLKDSEIYKSVLDSLGEKDTSGKQDDDDDIEVVRTDKDNEAKCKW